MLLDFLAGLPRELYVFLISMLPFIELRGAIPVGAALGMPFYTNFPIAIIGNMLPVPLILLFIPKILNFLERFKLFRPIVAWLRRTADKHSKKVIKEDVRKIGTAPEKVSKIDAAAEKVSESGAAAEKVSESGAATEEVSESGAATETVPKIDAAVEKNERKKTARASLMTPAIFLGLMLFVALPIPGTGAWSGSLVAALFSLSKKYAFLAVLCGVIICAIIMTLASYGVLGFLSFLL